MVGRAGIAETQQRWSAYRQAFVQLALKLHPSIPAEVWAVWVARPRVEQLSELAEGC